MLNLIKLELRKNNIRTYIIASIIITIVMLGFMYLFAYAPYLEPNDEDMKIFTGYRNILSLFSVMNMSAFCVLSSVMYSKIVIEEYSGKRTILLFSYPVSRSKMFLSKIAVVSIFSSLAMMMSNIIVFSTFGISELFFPLVNENFTTFIILHALKITIVMAILVAGLGIISTAIGFIKKSIPSTIISAILLCSLLCNVAAGTLSSNVPILIFGAIILVAAIIITTILSKKINCMEVI